MKKTNLIIPLLFTVFFLRCTDLIVLPASSNRHIEDFEAVWNRVNDVYPFLEFKQIDWDSLYPIYRQRVEAARGDEFYFVLHDMLAELRDGHVYYHTDGGGEVYPFYPQRHFKDRHGYSPFVVRSYFQEELTVTERKSAEYGILPDNIGYIFLADFQEDYLFEEFSEVFQTIRNTQGLIIDIRQKRGGNTLNVAVVLERIITAPLEWPEFYFLGERVETSPIQPRGPFTYTNPVVVLINGSTFSAGELCTEMLKQCPQVTAVGDTTGGGGGSGSGSVAAWTSDYELPSGKLISTPTGYIESYDGQMIEWLGVPPDVRIESNEEEIRNGVDRQLEYAISLLR